MIHSRFAIPVVSVLAVCALAATASAGPPAGCGTGSYIASTVDICAGVLVYRDYVHDDYGADQDLSSGPSTGSLSNPTGGVSYPAPNATVNNYADIAAIRLSVDGGQLDVEFEMNSMFTSGSTLVALAIDTDDDTATGGGVWTDATHGTLVANPEASIPLTSTGWDEIHFFASGDPSTNTLSGSIPLPTGTVWRIQAAAAVAANNVVMNVAFRGTGESGNWWENLQAAALKSGDVSAFGHTVDVSKLTGGVTERAVVGPGLYERVFESAVTLALGPGGEFVYDSDAEGVNYGSIPGRGVGGADPAFSQVFHFVGRRQPYGIYVPPGPQPHGMQLVMHGYNANHASLIGQPGMRSQVGDALNRILVVPLGRGPAGFYSDISELDVLEVMADVEDNYAIDLERVFSGGYSMGGYGTLRMATLYPHRFAGYMNWVGYPGDAFGQPDVNRSRAGEVGIPGEWLINLREVDGTNIYAALDELVNSAQGLWMRDLLADAGYPHIHWYHHNAEHLTFAVLDNWQKEAAYVQNLVRRTQPPRVTYRTEPWAATPELGLLHDAAYWVSEIRGASTGEREYVDVDVKTHACGGSERTFSAPQTQALGAGPPPLTWDSQFITVTGSTPIAKAPHIEATLSNVASLRVDTGSHASCLAGQEISYEITTDGPGEFRFSDGSVIDMPTAGTYTGSLPEPGAAISLAAGVLLVAGLARGRRG